MDHRIVWRHIFRRQEGAGEMVGRTPCHCILYLKKPFRRSIQSNMKTYLTSTTCRNNCLFHNMVGYTTESDSELCCDICDIRCKVYL